MNGATNRIVVLVDMDCFYVQVEQREKPELKGKPCAVVQYNQWKGGGIIAVGYEARAHGVSRNMRGDEAKQRCPEITLCSVPCERGKADLTRYRDAGAEVIRVLSRFSNIVERASIDEAYLDITGQVNEIETPTSALLENTFLVGRDNDAVKDWIPDLLAASPASGRLARGAVLVERMRNAVFEETGFRCSAGISHNKVLAKFACGMHKPNRQTILPFEAVDELYDNLSVKKIRNLGGKLGTSVVEDLGVSTMGQLRDRFDLSSLCEHFGQKTGQWLFALARGHDDEPVKGRQLAKSIGCSKTFPGRNSLDSVDKVRYWLQQLAAEVVERLDRDRNQNNRQARSLNLYVQHQAHPRPISSTRTCALTRHDTNKIVDDVMVLLRPFNTAHHGGQIWSPAITCLGLSASKFLQLDQSDGNIMQLLSSSASTSISVSVSALNNTAETQSKIQTMPQPLSTVNESADISKAKPRQSKRKSASSFFECLTSNQMKMQTPICNKSDDFTHDEKLLADNKVSDCVESNSKQSTPFSFFEKLRKDETPKEPHLRSTSQSVASEEIVAQKTEEQGEQDNDHKFHSDTDYMMCVECGKKILMFHMPEHQDFHLAQRIHLEIQNDFVTKDRSTCNTGTKSLGRKKRGRPPKMVSKRGSCLPKDNAGSLDTYFR